MNINDYKDALKKMIDATDDEAILKHWKTHLEVEFEQYRQRLSDQSKNPSAPKNKDEGYVIMESGLGIDE